MEGYIVARRERRVDHLTMGTSRRLALLCVLGLAACGPHANNGGDDVDAGDDTTPSCTPGDVEACYDGPTGTEGNGPCTAGTHTCGDTGQWGLCGGEVTPTGEVCANSIDDNCNGTVDEDVDSDGDGFTTCAGDCCDSTADGCQSPELVNPGAFEAPGNSLDDDCDGMVDNVAAANCDTGLASDSANALDYASAIDLCQQATENPGDTRWGVVSAQLVLPSGSGTPNAAQRAIRPAFGQTLVQSGDAFAVLSTGHAAATGQSAPTFLDFQGADPIGTTSAFPADWLAANGGTLPNAPGCPVPNGTNANDPVMLQLRIRTPTNAKSFKISTNFLSSEYPEWTCSAFNDFFVVLLDSGWSGTPANPSDKNLATYTSPTNQQYPVGVNLAYGDTGLFQECENGTTGCATNSGAVQGTITTCAGTGELTGTGMEAANPAPKFGGDPGYCGTNNLEGGGTGWLVTQGNVNGGEIITLRIALWDTSDGYYDSVAIIDNFQWSVDASQPGTVVN
jgi:hypothetical protein